MFAGGGVPIGTHSTERAIARYLLYLLARKGILPALSSLPDGRNREGNTSISAKADLF
jgi:hypothetical protein